MNETKIRVEFVGTMVRNISSKTPPIYVFKRGWIDPTTIQVGDHVSKHDPRDPMGHDVVSFISPICLSCNSVLGSNMNSCEPCLVSNIISS